MLFKITATRKATCQNKRVIFIDADSKEEAEKIVNNSEVEELLNKYPSISANGCQMTDSGWKLSSKTTVVKDSKTSEAAEISSAFADVDNALDENSETNLCGKD